MTDVVFQPVERVVDDHTELNGVAKDFADQLGAAYGARRDFKDNSEGGVW